MSARVLLNGTLRLLVNFLEALKCNRYIPVNEPIFHDNFVVYFNFNPDLGTTEEKFWTSHCSRYAGLRV